MTSVYITEKGHRLNYEMLVDQVQVTDIQEDVDILILWNKCIKGVRFDQQIVCQAEPPICGNVIYTYVNAGRWHTFVTHNPTTPNALPFSDQDQAYSPYWPWMEKRVTRKDDQLRVRGKGVYFAGHRHNRPDLRHHGAEIIYQLRAEWAEKLVAKLGGLAIGNGWAVTSKDHPDGWGARKFEEIKDGDYDFHFCADNCRLKGYVSEKFWHGLLSDRLTIYMGHEHIKDQVDPSAYVFAEDFDSPGALAEYLTAITPEQYRDYIYAGRKVLDGIGSRPHEERDILTQKIINRIRGEQK